MRPKEFSTPTTYALKVSRCRDILPGLLSPERRQPPHDDSYIALFFSLFLVVAEPLGRFHHAKQAKQSTNSTLYHGMVHVYVIYMYSYTNIYECVCILGSVYRECHRFAGSSRACCYSRSTHAR